MKRRFPDVVALMQIVGIALVAALAPGCVMVSTENPLYTEKDRVKDPALLGAWTPLAHNGGTIDLMEISLDEKGQYWLKPSWHGKRTGGKSPQVIDAAVVFKLGPHYLMEMGRLGFENENNAKAEARFFGKIALIDGRLFVSMPDGGLLHHALKGDKPPLKGRVTEGGGGNPGSITLTDTTENMRKFLLENAAVAFLYPLEAYRRPKDVKADASTELQTKEQESFEVIWLLWAHLRYIAQDALEHSVKDALKPVGAEEDLELVPDFALPENACDPKVADLYKKMRAALVAIKKNAEGLPDKAGNGVGAAAAASPGTQPQTQPYGMPRRTKEQEEELLAAMNRARFDPLGGLAEALPKDHPQRDNLKKLSTTLDKVTAEIEKKRDVMIRFKKDPASQP